MLFKKSPQKFWNLMASRYAASPIPDEAAYQAKIQKIRDYLTPKDTLLDIGCATGTQCYDLAGDVMHATGIDISSKLLSIAEHRRSERKKQNVEFMQTDVWDTRLELGGFNVVMAFYVMHFMQDIDVTFARIYDLLKPGGLFISETACLGEKNKIVGGLLRFAGMLGILPSMCLHTTEQLEQALVRAGFTLVDKVKFGQENQEYTLFAKKN